MRAVVFLILSCIAVAFASECEDRANPGFCASVAGDCNNPDFQIFYRDQCKKTCGFCDQRFFADAICSELTPPANSMMVCTSDEIGDGTSCKITCDENYKMVVVAPAEAMMTDERSYTRLCWCDMDRCSWIGGAEFAYCEKRKTDECEEISIDNAETSCNNGYSHLSTCMTKCSDGYKFTSVHAALKDRTYPAQTRNICICRGAVCKWYGSTDLQCTAIDAVSNWGEWSEWSTCSASCGRGERFKLRSCSQPGQCKGEPSKSESCLAATHCPCACSESAAGDCKDTNPSYCKYQVSRSRCKSFKFIQKICPATCGQCKNTQCECGTWGEWEAVGSCSKSCGKGTQKYVRTCPSGVTCSGETTDSKKTTKSAYCTGENCSRANKKTVKDYKKRYIKKSIQCYLLSFPCFSS